MKLAYLVYPVTKIRPTCIFAITMYCLIFTLTLNGSPVIFYGYVYKLPGMPNIRKDDGTSSSVSNYYLFSMWLKYHPITLPLTYLLIGIMSSVILEGKFSVKITV